MTNSESTSYFIDIINIIKKDDMDMPWLHFRNSEGHFERIN